MWRIDRLGRSLLDVLNTVNGLRENGIMVQSVSDGIDPATPTGRLMLNMLATLAEYERELIVERVNAGITAARGAGTIFGRPATDPALTAEKLTIVAKAMPKEKQPNRQLALSAGAGQRSTGTSKDIQSMQI